MQVVVMDSQGIDDVRRKEFPIADESPLLRHSEVVIKVVVKVAN